VFIFFLSNAKCVLYLFTVAQEDDFVAALKKSPASYPCSNSLQGGSVKLHNIICHQ